MKPMEWIWNYWHRDGSDFVDIGYDEGIGELLRIPIADRKNVLPELALAKRICEGVNYHFKLLSAGMEAAEMIRFFAQYHEAKSRENAEIWLARWPFPWVNRQYRRRQTENLVGRCGEILEGLWN